MTESADSDRDDRRLAEALSARRDPRSFAQLYDRHTAQVYRFALRLTAGDVATAEDLVHDAWVVAVEKLPGFEWRSSFRTWLSGIVVNLARTRLRGDQREAPLLDTLVLDEEPLRGVIDRVDLMHALVGLAPGFRIVLLLHDVEGYTHQEIATLMDIDVGTSKSQLSRARAAMRRALGDHRGSHVG